MNFEILHNGKNIRDSIELIACSSCDRYGGLLDDLTISFNSNSSPADFRKDDELIIRTAGGYTTGTMYLDSCVGQDSQFTINALSCRHENKKRKSRVWYHVKLTKIISDVANNTGLEPMLIGIKDYTYASVSQIMEADIQFLARICKREGYSIKCDNGKLIVFNEYYLEHNSTPIAISKGDVEAGYSFNRSINGLASVTVRCFNLETLQPISYTAHDNEISGGEDIRLEFVKDISEAQRFAVGYLHDANKAYISGVLRMSYNDSISAGTVATLTGFEEFDGLYVVCETKHDFVREKTTIKVRKVLEY